MRACDLGDGCFESRDISLLDYSRDVLVSNKLCVGIPLWSDTHTTPSERDNEILVVVMFTIFNQDGRSDLARPYFLQEFFLSSYRFLMQSVSNKYVPGRTQK